MRTAAAAGARSRPDPARPRRRRARRARDHRGQVPQYRVGDQFPQRHQTVELDHEPDGGQRRAAEGEEVVVAADPAHQHPQHLRPRGGEPALGLGGGRQIGGDALSQLAREPRQQLLVRLAVLGEGQGVQAVEVRRHHVLGQCAGEEVTEVGRLHVLRAGVEGHQVLGLVLSSRDHHGGLRDPRHLEQPVLYLADLDPVPAHLHLLVPPPEELDGPLGQPPAVVAGPVQPGARQVRVLGERLGRALRVVDVAAADTHPGERDLPGSTERNGTQPLVEDVGVHVAQRAADVDHGEIPLRHPVEHRVHGVVRHLGRAVGVDQPDVRVEREPPLDQAHLERLAGDRDGTQIAEGAPAALQVGQHHVEVGGNDLDHLDPAGGHQADEPVDVQLCLGVDDQCRAAGQQRRQHLPERDVEALGGGLGDHLAGLQLHVVDLGVQVVEHALVLAHRPLGGAVEPEVK